MRRRTDGRNVFQFAVAHSAHFNRGRNSEGPVLAGGNAAETAGDFLTSGLAATVRKCRIEFQSGGQRVANDHIARGIWAGIADGERVEQLLPFLDGFHGALIDAQIGTFRLRVTFHCGFGIVPSEILIAPNEVSLVTDFAATGGLLADGEAEVERFDAADRQVKRSAAH